MFGSCYYNTMLNKKENNMKKRKYTRHEKDLLILMLKNTRRHVKNKRIYMELSRQIWKLQK